MTSSVQNIFELSYRKGITFKLDHQILEYSQKEDLIFYYQWSKWKDLLFSFNDSVIGDRQKRDYEALLLRFEGRWLKMAVYGVKYIKSQLIVWQTTVLISYSFTWPVCRQKQNTFWKCKAGDSQSWWICLHVPCTSSQDTSCHIFWGNDKICRSNLCSLLLTKSPTRGKKSRREKSKTKNVVK